MFSVSGGAIIKCKYPLKCVNLACKSTGKPNIHELLTLERTACGRFFLARSCVGSGFYAVTETRQSIAAKGFGFAFP
jgi:hypothetical protein